MTQQHLRPLLIIPIFILLGLMTVTLWFDINKTVFLWLNHQGHLLPDKFWAHITTLGDALLAPVLLFIVGWRYPALLRAGVITALLAAVVTHTLKSFFDWQRPAAILDINSFYIVGPSLTSHSFPSGHTLTAFTVAGLIIFFFKKQSITIFLLLLALFAGMSRIMVGAHWPADVLFGAALGWGCACLGLSIESKLNTHITTKSQAYLIIFFMMISGLLFLRATPYPAAQWFAWIVASGALFIGFWSLMKLKRAVS